MNRGCKKNRVFNPKGMKKLGPVLKIDSDRDRERLPHGVPEATPHNIPGDRVICKKSKGQLIRFEGKYLPDEVRSYEGEASRLRHDVNDLWPQLNEELKVEMRKRHNTKWFKYHGAEIQVWKRFCHSYTRFYQNAAKACDFCGISRGHYYRARQLYPTLNLILDIIEDRLMDEVEETMKKHSLLPNSIVERIFLLKTRRRDKYGDTPQLVSATKIEVNIPNISSMRDSKESNVKIGIEDNDGLSTPTDPIEVSPIKE